MADDNRRIKIYEIDGTSPGTAVVAEDVVYVPGFINKKFIGQEGIVEAFVPTLCSTVAEFEGFFGNIPAAFEQAQPWPAFCTDAIPENSEAMFEALQMDPSYVYAKELLSAGLQVVYERVNKKEDGSDITAAYMYDVLNGAVEAADIWQNLRDMGEYYEIKYLTSGGYPTFEYQGDIPNVKFMESSDAEISEVKGTLIVNKTTLMKKLGTVHKDATFRFIWGYERTLATECANNAERDAYKETAKEDEFYYVRDDDTMYRIKITKTKPDEGPEIITREWEVVDWKVWSVINTDTKEIKQIGNALTSYGIAIALTPVRDFTFPTTIDFEYDVVESSPVVTAMLACAANRGDCVALIDHTDNPNRLLDPNKTSSVYYSATNANSKYRIGANGEFGAMFTPWCGISTSTKLNDSSTKYTVPKTMPSSFIYLKALAQSIQTNANWLAIAGAARGVVDITGPSLSQTLRLSNTLAEDYQPRQGIAINPITNIKPYGYTIWGNRTLKNNLENLTATSFLNIRNIVSDVKKTAYLAARRCMFEQNSDILWLNYKARVTPLLDKLVAGAGLSGYDLIQGTTTEKAKLVCTIRLYPLYAVEAFEITVELADQEITVS